MGVSTDAIIFYGYVWDEETSTPWTIDSGDEDEESDDDSHDDEDWEARYASKYGLTKPEKPFPDKGYDLKAGKPITNYTPEEQAIVDEWKAYFDAKRKIVEASPCEVDTHCSGECPMPYVCVKDSYVCNSRGDYTELKPEQFEVEEHWNDQLKKFCNLMGITMPAGGPKWYLVSYWG